MRYDGPENTYRLYLANRPAQGQLSRLRAASVLGQSSVGMAMLAQEPRPWLAGPAGRQRAGLGALAPWHP